MSAPEGRPDSRRRTAVAIALAATIFAFLAPVDAGGREVFVVRLLTDVPFVCPASAYRDALIFHNTTQSDQRVTALSASNGYRIPPGQDLIVPAGRTRTVYILAFGNEGAGGVENLWAPARPSPVFLTNKLDVPEGVIVESRGEIFSFGGTDFPCPTGPGTAPPLEVLGHFALPITTSLTSANTPHFHLASDIGTLASRTNVGIYNGELMPASATIEVRSACDDRVLETLRVDVPGDTFIYFSGFRNTVNNGACFDGSSAADYTRYIVVTMDRAGFSFVGTRAETLPPRVTLGSVTPR